MKYNIANSSIFFENVEISEVSDCQFVNNTSLFFGGAITAISYNYSKINVNNSYFYNNSALDSGGALYLIWQDANI